MPKSTAGAPPAGPAHLRGLQVCLSDGGGLGMRETVRFFTNRPARADTNQGICTEMGAEGEGKRTLEPRTRAKVRKKQSPSEGCA